jgi:quinol monooxygenase YgiN
MSITSLFEFQLKPEVLDSALPVMHAVFDDTRAFDGNLGVTLVQDSMDPTRIIAVERWASIEHDTAYRQWRAGEGAATELRALLAGAPKLTIAVDLDDV